MDIVANFTILTDQIISLVKSPFSRLMVLVLTAQFASMLLKMMINVIRSRKLNMKIMFNYGGMPSSHTVLLTSFCFGVGLDPQLGWLHPLFTISVIISSVIVVDTIRFRGNVDKLNRIIKKVVEHDNVLAKEIKMPKMIAHTSAEVVVGVIFAGLYTILFYLLFYNVLQNG